MARLPRLTLTNTPLRPRAGPTETYRVSSPCGGSTLMTSAPMSAMIWVQYGPITIAVRSTTRTPFSGPELGMLCRPFEAVPNVVGVPIGHDRKHQWRIEFPDGVDLSSDFFDRPRVTLHTRAFDDGHPGHPAGDGHQHLPVDRAGFVRQQAHHRSHQLGAHRRVRRNIQTLGHSRHRRGHDDVAEHA